MEPLRRLSETARRRYGVVSIRDARLAGLSRRQVDRLVAKGVLHRPARGVLAFTAVAESWHQRVMIAVTAAGPPALASHRTAAYLHDLVDRPPKTVEVVMPRWDRSAQPGFTVHESLDLIPDDATRVGSIPVTIPARTVVDLGAVAPRMVEGAVQRGLRLGKLTLDDIADFVARVARRGRRGVGPIRPVLLRMHELGAITDSDLEDLFLRRWGSRRPVPVAQYVILDEHGLFVCRADFAFPEARLRIELDSEAHHMDRDTFRSDRAKQNRTELLGWRTLRYTWWDLVSRPAAVIAEIEAALAATPPFPHTPSAVPA